MTDIRVEVELLERLSKAWSNEVKTGLTQAASKIDDLKFSRLQAGIFQIPWDNYINTANYIQERLREGAAQAERIGGALHSAAMNFDSQDSDRAQGLRQVMQYGDVDFSI
ncbi:hypothetical protein [Nocardia gamkensis]|uniref:hypothetical protein n=1 Tax=Nocardia gamkensis TaxID=352869 RepID=UPI0037CAAEE1